MDKAIIKFNNGNLALLCSRCHGIIKTGKEFTKEELDLTLGSDKNMLLPQYCDDCKLKPND